MNKAGQEKGNARSEKPAEVKGFSATVEIEPWSEPFYDMGPHSALIPIHEGDSQNFDLSEYGD